MSKVGQTPVVAIYFALRAWFKARDGLLFVSNLRPLLRAAVKLSVLEFVHGLMHLLLPPRFRQHAGIITRSTLV
jgi:hypothetical protein